MIQTFQFSIFTFFSLNHKLITIDHFNLSSSKRPRTLSIHDIPDTKNCQSQQKPRDKNASSLNSFETHLDGLALAYNFVKKKRIYSKFIN
jgi:hypothetical protein